MPPKPGTPPRQEASFAHVCILRCTLPCRKENELMERRREKKEGRKREEERKGRTEGGGKEGKERERKLMNRLDNRICF